MRGCWLAVLLLAGCVTAPADPLVRADRACARGDLMLALRTLDAVPVKHAHYPQARARAVGIEQQMRKSQELLLQGMVLRMEWRDQEAIAAFQKARGVWRQLPGIDDMLAATRSRLQVFGLRAVPVPTVGAIDPAAEQLAAPAVETAPVAPPFAPPPVVPVQAAVGPLEPPASAPPPAPILDSSQQLPVVAVAAIPPPSSPAPAVVADEAPPVLELGQTAAGDAAVAPSGDPDHDSVGAQLAAVEQLLSRGDVELALRRLLELRQAEPTDVRVCLRMARVLHQRALLRYGRGDVSGAVADWRRAITLDPAFDVAKRTLPQAEAELARQQAGREKKAGG